MIEQIDRYVASLVVSVVLGWTVLIYSVVVHSDPFWYAVNLVPGYLITMATYVYGVWGLWLRPKPPQEIEAGI